MYKSLLVGLLFSLPMYGMQNNKIDPQQVKQNEKQSKKESAGIVVGGAYGAALHASIAVKCYPVISTLPILGGVPGWILLGTGIGAYAGYKYMRGEFSVPTTNNESKK